MDDTQAIARLKRGDIDGLSTLITRYQVRALRTAYLVTQDAVLAEDVVQDAFVSVYRFIGSFDPARPFAPWFMRIVVNGAIRASRQGQADLSLDLLADEADLDAAGLLEDASPGPDLALEAAETEEMVWAALGALTPIRRAVIVMRFYLEMSEAEMAEQLEIPVGTVKSRLYAARRQLVRLLADQISTEKR